MIGSNSLTLGPNGATTAQRIPMLSVTVRSAKPFAHPLLTKLELRWEHIPQIHPGFYFGVAATQEVDVAIVELQRQPDAVSVFGTLANPSNPYPTTELVLSAICRTAEHERDVLACAVAHSGHGPPGDVGILGFRFQLAGACFG